ncbi:cupin domain-containing protein [Mycolicibacterium sp. 018/SC-01/001]|uniref:cupin domain-containing protein n=1 Tax=Mycolicibacterium sp. 018/SC-01/001 TaxID=2592069 RepID=UPI00117D865F|nr:cupin domain-containing protein [Mycolicibacterium sp. 018/SC-01/001]TRW81015.1 cupin domain-containing protein [Mycolicibacterium sp. 018/SC-01/001]
MSANAVTHAARTPLDLIAVPTNQAVNGHPHTGTTIIGEFAGLEVGIWEMTQGTMRDVESDEIFIVISGSAQIQFTDSATTLEIGSGDLVRLTAGTQTVWTVHETLRKVYLA